MPDNTPFSSFSNVETLTAFSTADLLDELTRYVKSIYEQRKSIHPINNCSSSFVNLPIYVVVPPSMSSDTISRRLSEVSTYGIEVVSFSTLLSKLSTILGIEPHPHTRHLSQRDERIVLTSLIRRILIEHLDMDEGVTMTSILQVRRFMNNLRYWHKLNVNELGTKYEDPEDFCRHLIEGDKYKTTASIVLDSMESFRTWLAEHDRISYDDYLIDLTIALSAISSMPRLDIIFISPDAEQQSIPFFCCRASENEQINISVIQQDSALELPAPAFSSDGVCAESIVNVIGHNAEGYAVLSEMEKIAESGVFLDDIAIASSFSAGKAEKILRALEQLSCSGGTSLPPFLLREAKTVCLSDTELGRYFIALMFGGLEDLGMWRSFLNSAYSGISPDALAAAVSDIGSPMETMKWAWQDKEGMYNGEEISDELREAFARRITNGETDGVYAMAHATLAGKLSAMGIDDAEEGAERLLYILALSDCEMSANAGKYAEYQRIRGRQALEWMLISKYPELLDIRASVDGDSDIFFRKAATEFSSIGAEDREVVQVLRSHFMQLDDLDESPSEILITGLGVKRDIIYNPVVSENINGNIDAPDGSNGDQEDIEHTFDQILPTVTLCEWWDVPDIGRKHVIVLDTDMESERSYLAPDAMSGVERMALGEYLPIYIDRWVQQRETYRGIADILEHVSKNPDNSHVSFLYMSRNADAKEMPMSAVLEDVLDRLVDNNVYEDEKHLDIFTEKDMWDGEGIAAGTGGGKEGNAVKPVDDGAILPFSPVINPATLTAEDFKFALEKHRRDKTGKMLAMSPSELNMLWQCPAKWLFSKYGIGYDEAASGTHLIKGSVIHKGMELFYKDRAAEAAARGEKAGHLTREEVEALGDLGKFAHNQAKKAIDVYEEENKSKIAFSSDRERKEFLDEITEAIQNLICLDIEFEPDYVPLEMERSVAGEYAGVYVNGIIDRIDAKDDGNSGDPKDFIIIDYKGDVAKYGCSRDSGEPKFIQAHIYASLYQRTFDHDNVDIHVCYRSYQSNKESNIRVHPGTNSKKTFDEIEQTVGELLKAIQGNSEFNPTKRCDEACRYCFLKTVCHDGKKDDYEK